jgi:hypothetical protein
LKKCPKLEKNKAKSTKGKVSTSLIKEFANKQGDLAKAKKVKTALEETLVANGTDQSFSRARGYASG